MRIGSAMTRSRAAISSIASSGSGRRSGALRAPRGDVMATSCCYGAE
jgi:hypothetical protein